MNQFFEAALIALSSIWANKLRSFLTVLGNIVAVASIIAVVSLIQGMNAYVSSAIITDVGADNFTIQRMPVVRSVEDEERVRNNPRITLRDADAVRRFSDNIHAVAAQANASGRIAGEQSLDRVDPGRVARLPLLLDVRRRTRPADQPDRDRPQPPGDRPRLGGRRQAVRRPRSARPHHQDQRRALPRRRRQREEGVDLRAVAGRVRDHPARHVLQAVRLRPGMQLLVKPRTLELVQPAMDDATVAMRIERRLRPKEPDNFGMFTSDTLLGLYRSATAGLFAVLIGVVALSLVVGASSS